MNAPVARRTRSNERGADHSLRGPTIVRWLSDGPSRRKPRSSPQSSDHGPVTRSKSRFLDARKTSDEKGGATIIAEWQLLRRLGSASLRAAARGWEAEGSRSVADGTDQGRNEQRTKPSALVVRLVSTTGQAIKDWVHRNAAGGTNRQTRREQNRTGPTPGGPGGCRIRARLQATCQILQDRRGTRGNAQGCLRISWIRVVAAAKFCQHLVLFIPRSRNEGMKS
jgi:hypothetical protein